MREMNRNLAIALVLLISLCVPANSGAADFARPKTYPVGTSPSEVVVGDFNGDGKPDIAVLNSGSSNLSILLGNGDGTFQSAKNFDVGGDGPTSIAAADLNGDGKIDLVVAIPGNIPAPPTTFGSCTQSSVNLMLGNGDGTFQAARRAVTVDSTSLSVNVGDLNGDGRTDLVVLRTQIDPACPAPGGSILLGNGDGSFQAEKSFDANGPILVGDFNGDGRPDLVAGGSILLLGNGDGTFQPSVALPLPGGCGLFCVQTFSNAVAADFNGDGKLDLAIGRATRRCIDGCVDPSSFSILVLLGNGDGTFQPAPSVGSGGSVILSADLNGDGNVDLIAAPTVFNGSSLFFVYLGKGDGTFPTQITFDIGSGPSYLLAADLNGDKLPDIIAADFTETAVSVLLNTSPTSGANLELTLSSTSADVSLGDGDVNYAATVLNEGPQNDSGVILTENLPSGLKFVSAQTSQGTCSRTATVTCDLGAMKVQSMATVQFIVTPAVAGTFTADLEVTATKQDLDPGNNSASFTVTAVQPDFTLSPVAQNLTMKRGGQASEVLIVGTQSGFTGSIALACSVSGPSPMPTCGISPASVTPGTNATLTVSGASLSASLTAPWFEHGDKLQAAAWLPLGLLGCILGTGFAKKRRKMWALCLLLMATILPAACGGGSNSPQQQVQTYTVTITATSGAIQHSTAIAVTVE